MIINSYRFAAAETGIKAGLVAWYDLEEASGTRVDAHTNGLDLTENGTVGSATGKVGDCAFKTVFDNGSLYHADDTNFDIEGDMTIAGWVYMESLTNNLAFVSKWLGATSDKSYILYKPSGLRTVRFIASSDGAASSLTLETTALALDTWFFITLKFVAGGTSTLYVDNSSFDTGTAPSAIHNSSSRFELFSFNTGAITTSKGGIDSLGIWNRALEASEITTLYNSGSGVAYSDL